jgi:4-amino-4-deoxy-L-arabinose transferase-like glycosyltransferase
MSLVSDPIETVGQPTTAGHGPNPWPHRIGVLAITVLAAIAYAWSLGQDALEPYYEASVRSMAASEHNFLYGAFDPAGTITLDKLPGALWLQALSVAIFGLHTWAIVLPQVLEGALAVVALDRAVARLAGPAAGLISAAVLAISPAVVALDRGNIGDSLLILLLILAAERVSKAVVTGRTAPLVLAGVWVGLAFQAKMLQAWLILPAFAVTYLLARRTPIADRLRQLGLAGAVTVVVSLAWMALTSITPSGYRPYVDGTTNDSWFEQVFVYNGVGRIGGQTPLQLLAGQSLGATPALTAIPPSPWRLLEGDLGRDAGWLLPAAVVIAIAILVSRRGQPRTDPIRAAVILWSGWLLLDAIVFSAASSINPYYTAALAPAVAALVGIGASVAWQSRSRLTAAVAGLVVVVTAGYAFWLLPTAGSAPPPWLRPAAIGLAVVTLAVIAVRTATSGRGSRHRLAVAVTLVSIAAIPAVASVSIVDNGRGAFDTPFETVVVAGRIHRTFITTPADVRDTVPTLLSAQRGAPYLLAVQSAAIASVFIDATGLEALPIGGFTGTGPTPTLAQIKADVCSGQFHLALIGDDPDPRLQWIATNCIDLHRAAGGLRDYYCVPPAGC